MISTAASLRGMTCSRPFFDRAGGNVHARVLRSSSRHSIPATSLRRAPVIINKRTRSPRRPTYRIACGPDDAKLIVAQDAIAPRLGRRRFSCRHRDCAHRAAADRPAAHCPELTQHVISANRSSAVDNFVEHCVNVGARKLGETTPAPAGCDLFDEHPLRLGQSRRFGFTWRATKIATTFSTRSASGLRFGPTRLPGGLFLVLLGSTLPASWPRASNAFLRAVARSIAGWGPIVYFGAACRSNLIAHGPALRSRWLHGRDRRPANAPVRHFPALGWKPTFIFNRDLC